MPVIDRPIRPSKGITKSPSWPWRHRGSARVAVMGAFTRERQPPIVRSTPPRVLRSPDYRIVPAPCRSKTNNRGMRFWCFPVRGVNLRNRHPFPVAWCRQREQIVCSRRVAL